MSDELETPQPEEQSEATEAEAAEATEAPTDEEPSDSVQNASDPQVEDDDDGDDDGPGDESTVAVQQPSLTQDHRDAMAPTAARRVAFDDDRDYSDDEFAEMLGMYEETLQVKAQQIVNGTVLAVTENEVVVDIGFKSEGAIALSEFGDEPEIEVGDEVEVFLEDVEDQDGQVVVSKQKADFMRVWDHIKDAYDSGLHVDGTVQRRIKGGLVVDLFGVDAFLPGSQIDLRQVKNFGQYIGLQFPFRIIKLNKSRRNIVVSRRVVLEEEREQMRATLLAELEKDQTREGIVKNITDFGAFIDLGGADGLLHITDMSWGRVNHPSDVITIGATVNVKVLNYDRERERISLGLKQLSAYPWENVEEKYPVSTKVVGRVVSITDYGAFVELEEGVEGLIHISEMSWTQHVRHPSKILTVQEEVETMVLRVNAVDEKISLGLKQCQPDPWESLDVRYPVGSCMVGAVRNITNFGVFVEIEPGIDGLVHISDLSWTKRVKHPSELVNKDDELEVVVLNIDKEQRRISLSHKHIEDNPWDKLELRYGPGKVSAGVIVRLTDKDVVVEMDGDIEGFVPISQLGIADIRNVEEHFAEGETLNLVVSEFDREQKRIILSAKEYLSRQDQGQIEAYEEAHALRPVTIGDLAGDTLSDLVEQKNGETEEAKETSDEVESDDAEEDDNTSDAAESDDAESNDTEDDDDTSDEAESDDAESADADKAEE